VDSVEHLIHALKTPRDLVKFGNNFKVKFRKFYLTPDLKELRWDSANKGENAKGETGGGPVFVTFRERTKAPFLAAPIFSCGSFLVVLSLAQCSSRKCEGSCLGSGRKSFVAVTAKTSATTLSPSPTSTKRSLVAQTPSTSSASTRY
jgi:hypothetical protein